MRDKLILLSGAVLACGSAMAGATILGLAPWAHAQNNDWLFYEQVQAANIPGSQKAAVDNAHLACEWLDQGVDPQLVVANMSTGTGLTIGQSITFVTLSVDEYCPTHLLRPTAPHTPSNQRIPEPSHEYYGDEPFGPHIV